MRLFQCGRPRKTAGPGHRGFARAAHRRHERLRPRARRPRTRQDPLLGGARRAPLGRGLRRQVRALLLADLRRPLSEKPPAEALRPAGELHRRAARRLQKPRHRDPDFKPRPLPRAQRGRFGRRSRMARRFGHEVYAQGLAGRRAGFGRVFGQRRALPPA